MINHYVILTFNNVNEMSSIMKNDQRIKMSTIRIINILLKLVTLRKFNGHHRVE